jgi:hypothetical protein
MGRRRLLHGEGRVLGRAAAFAGAGVLSRFRRRPVEKKWSARDARMERSLGRGGDRLGVRQL